LESEALMEIAMRIMMILVGFGIVFLGLIISMHSSHWEVAILLMFGGVVTMFGGIPNAE